MKKESWHAEIIIGISAIILVIIAYSQPDNILPKELRDIGMIGVALYVIGMAIWIVYVHVKKDHK